MTVGLLLVFVDTVKELPLTFALRPSTSTPSRCASISTPVTNGWPKLFLPALMILALGLVAAMALVPSLDQASSKG